MVDADVEALVFEDFFRDEFPRLVPMLHALTGDRHRAEDLAQDALAKAQRDWRRISTYDRRSSGRSSSPAARVAWPSTRTVSRWISASEPV